MSLTVSPIREGRKGREGERERERESVCVCVCVFAGRQLRGSESDNWGWGQFGNVEAEERHPLETVTKQRSEDRYREH
jgi:hypothetical protein